MKLKEAYQLVLQEANQELKEKDLKYKSTKGALEVDWARIDYEDMLTIVWWLENKMDRANET